MGGLIDILNELCDETKLKVRVLDYNNNEIFDNLPTSESNVTRKIYIGNKTFKVVLEQDNIKLIPMVEYVINKIIKKENIIEELIQGRKQWDALEEDSIKNSNKLLLIESNNKNEVLYILKNTYENDNIFVGEIYDRLLIIGRLEDEIEHAISIKDTINETLGIKAKVSIVEYYTGYEGFINAYNEAIEALEIGDILKIKPEIYNMKEMYLEKAISNLSKEYSEELKRKYKDIFKGFNHELSNTLEEIIKCDLSLTKASKNLYVHRNTLMYRVEKIKKETGFDIRNFKEATFLYILYMNNKRE